MTAELPSKHPLKKVFRAALDRAFGEYRNLYSPDVAEHLEDNVLGDFVHVDRVYRLRDMEGRRLEDFSDMIELSRQNEGPERRFEVDRYIGDFVIFMGGFFPSLLRGTGFPTEPMISRVGAIVVNYERPFDYYIAEGRNAYSRAAKTARIFDPESQHTYQKLGSQIEDYLDLVGAVKRFIEDDPQLREEGHLDDGEE
ncbi:MAG: hypothetical protein AAF517_01710 [Planctomycetota bacterium]